MSAKHLSPCSLSCNVSESPFNGQERINLNNARIRLNPFNTRSLTLLIAETISTVRQSVAGPDRTYY